MVAPEWEINYNDENGYVSVSASGVFTTRDLKDFTTSVIECLNNNDCLRLFLDLSEISIRFSILDVYRLPSLFKKLNVDHKTHTALIPSKNGRYKEIYDFFETVCFNKGYHIRQFGDVAEAKNWLTSL